MAGHSLRWVARFSVFGGSMEMPGIVAIGIIVGLIFWASLMLYPKMTVTVFLAAMLVIVLIPSRILGRMRADEIFDTIVDYISDRSGRR